jgi:hypothetical protein
VARVGEYRTCRPGRVRAGVPPLPLRAVGMLTICLYMKHPFVVCCWVTVTAKSGPRWNAIRANGARDDQSFDGMAKHPNERGGHIMTENDYAEMGIRFDTEEVSKQRGDHASDRVVIGNAQIAVVTDLDKFRTSFGDATILGILDGTSIRVMSQDVSRRSLEKGVKAADAIQAGVINRLKGVRNAGGTRTITVTKVSYSLPDGTKYEGADETEYQQLFAGALVDAGVPAAAALAIASNQKLA